MRSLVLAGFAIVVSLGIGLPLTGCDNLFGLDHVELPPADKDNGYVCTCDCTYPDGGTSTADIKVCALGSQNPNLPAGVTPTAEQLRDDCATDRVQVQAQRMARECYARGADCSCRVAGTAEAPTPVTFYAEVCDEGCVARPLVVMNGVCTNWDSGNGIANANCATDNLCNDPGPVCLAPFGDLAGAMMGRLAQCDVDEGDITVNVDGSERTLPVGGAVQFLPIACGSGKTCIVPSYLLRTSGSMDFEALLGLDSVSVRDIRTLGTSSALLLDEFGAGQIAENGSINSGRAIQHEVTLGLFDETTQVNAIGGNDDPVDLLFDGAQCGISGALAGGVGDPDGDNSGFNLTVAFSGTVVNTPPNAVLGADRTVECTDATGADVTLDAGGSTDAENNIVHYGWFGDTRAGEDLGTGVTLTLHQALGARTYFVKPVDAYMQADEDDANVTVQDSTGPSIACNAPATITPRRTPYAFTATASDTCGSISGAATVVRAECFAFNGSGKRVAKSCNVRLSGATFTIIDSSGVGNHFLWTVRAGDSNGNSTEQTCETEVIKPGPGPT
jgi:hypothetical protein